MRAVIVGGTGAIGVATARALVGAGWQVAVTGRDPALMPAVLSSRGVGFTTWRRGDHEGLRHLLGRAGAPDLVVHLLAYHGAADIEPLTEVMHAVGHTVVVSGRAVYRDDAGRHLNSEQPPRFPVPIAESQPTLDPAGPDLDPMTREGYGPGKVSVEQAALASGAPVTVLRPSKVHGPYARNPRSASVVQAVQAAIAPTSASRRGRARLAVPDAAAVDHLSAAAHVAGIIETIAERPQRAAINIADPDTPTAVQIVEQIARQVGWEGQVEAHSAATAAEAADPDVTLIQHPWRPRHPVVLDLTAAAATGYRPRGTALELMAEEVGWWLGRQDRAPAH